MSWFTGSGERPRRSQSRVLSSDDGHLFILEMHRVKPDCMDDYLKEAGEHLIRVSENKDVQTELLGSWTTSIGPVQDQATHIWKYESYQAMQSVHDTLKEDKHWNEYAKSRGKMIDRRSSQVILPFTFWEPVDPKTTSPKGLFEMRTYTLIPGTLIEWGQAWENGIKYRKDESVGGWFSQIGEMHQVHHLWAYKNLPDRKEQRQAAWEFPGWDECVVKTVPLIRYMVVRILRPTPFSPLK